MTTLVHSIVHKSSRCLVGLVRILVEVCILVHDEGGVLLVTGLLQPLVNSDRVTCV